MELADGWSVMKWVLLVLLAGFIGQFGKTLAQQVLKRFRKEPQTPVRAGGYPGEKLPATPQSDVPPRPDPPAAIVSAPQAAPPVGTAPAPADKKLMKALAKQKKKEAKALQKADKG